MEAHARCAASDSVFAISHDHDVDHVNLFFSRLVILGWPEISRRAITTSLKEERFLLNGQHLRYSFEHWGARLLV